MGSLVEELLKAAGVGGWTIIRDVAGMGHSGFHQGKTIFNDQSGLVMFVGVAEEKVIADVARGLLPQDSTGILVPSGSVFREQNIILAAAGEESMPRFHAPKLFMGAASIGAQGVMQADAVLVAADVLP